MATRTISATMTARHLALRILVSLGLVLLVGSFLTEPAGMLRVFGVALLVAGLAVLAPHDEPSSTD